MQKLGNVSEKEMFRTFNMGIGMVVICSGSDVETLKGRLESCYEIGKVTSGSKDVLIV
jgi:phosphoribosylformylglycinamidine cyclo-ligase